MMTLPPHSREWEWEREREREKEWEEAAGRKVEGGREVGKKGWRGRDGRGRQGEGKREEEEIVKGREQGGQRE